MSNDVCYVECPGCGKEVDEEIEKCGVWHRYCFETRPQKLSPERRLLALKRIRAIIAGGRKLIAVDDDTVGNKHTYCSWGMCSEDKEAWPNPIDHMFPHDFRTRGRMSPLPYGRCPLEGNRASGSGCFYGCRGFKRISREETLALYDTMIKQLGG